MSEEHKNSIRSWWDNYPFTYFLKEDVGSWAFFRNIDRKVLKWHPWAQNGYPLLSNLVPYAELKGKRVLDIGCGSGWSTEQFIRAGADVSAIDLTPKAIELTKKRLELYGLKADVQVADAEHIPFPDATFDYVLAWGVLMHTPDTEQTVREIHRVLKQGGRAGAMMYNKNSLHWRWFIWFSKGILRLQLLRKSMQEITNRYTDGAEIGGNMLTKFYTPKEFKKMWSVFKEVRVATFDDLTAVEHFPHRFLPLGKLLPTFLKKKIACRFGLSAWIAVQK